MASEVRQEFIEAAIRHGRLDRAEALLAAHPELAIGDIHTTAIVSGWVGRSAVSTAARRGRSDVLEAFERRGLEIEVSGVEKLISACARNDAEAVRTISEREPELVEALLKEGGTLLAEFAGTANTNNEK